MRNQTPTSSHRKEPQWTILKLLAWTTSYFESHDVDSPRTDAEILLAHALEINRIDLYVRYDQPLQKDELARFKTLIKRRIAYEPVAYIVGKKEFWSMSLTVSPDVLIPRPETECLVEAILNILPEIPVQVLVVLPGQELDLVVDHSGREDPELLVHRAALLEQAGAGNAALGQRLETFEQLLVVEHVALHPGGAG